MNTILAIAKKELRTYFLSPIALLFIAVFLVAALFSFFWVDGFFARNSADIRPLFARLPVLLIFLVPALGMRLWSEEERTGTMETLRTMPLRIHHMVIGKFLGGMGLVAVALLLTLPLPITVSMLGDLDWGPVWGGYLATLLLAGAYLSLTICISALTSVQIVALVFGAGACALLYLIGSDSVAGLFGNEGAELLRSIGAGSRFDSVQRGVIDLRDLLYFGSLILFFGSLNVLFLQSRRWSGSATRRSNRLNWVVFVVLLGLNLVAINMVGYSVRGLRVDLTERDEYSISDVTKELLRGVDEPLLIRGYFSAKTHPLLSPLVPRIRDMVEEYGAVGGSNVTAEFLDPTDDEELEKEAQQSYGIRSVPFQFESRHEASIVNSYFSLLIRYGDQHQTLSFQELIEVDARAGDINVSLRNLEYDLTRAIQKVVYGFQSLESVFARLPQDAELLAFISRDQMPERLAEVPGRIDKVAKDLAARSGGRFKYTPANPDDPDSGLSPEKLYDSYGIQPIPISLFDRTGIYMHLLLKVGDSIELVSLGDGESESDIENALVASLKRAGPGSLKTVGVYADEAAPPAPPQQIPGMPQPQGLSFRALRDVLGQTYDVRDVTLDSGSIPGDIDVLLVVNAKGLDDKATFAIDQFLMRGGSVVVLGGKRVVDPNGMAGLAVETIDPGLDGILGSYGVTIRDDVLLDQQNAAYPIPVVQDVGGFKLRRFQLIPYPAFPDIRQDQMAENPALAGLPNAVLHWASPVEFAAGDAAEGEDDKSEGLDKASVLLRSTDGAWLPDSYDAQPDLNKQDLGWTVPASTRSYPVAVSLVGPFDSHFKGGEAPDLGESTASVIESSSERSRLVVIGSASFVSDLIIQMTRQVDESYMANLQLVQNLVDWCMEDVELLKIRARGNYTRVLDPASVEKRKSYEAMNYLVALLSVLAIGGFTLGRRRRATPMELLPPSRGASGADAPREERA